MVEILPTSYELLSTPHTHSPSPQPSHNHKEQSSPTVDIRHYTLSTDPPPVLSQLSTLKCIYLNYEMKIVGKRIRDVYCVFFILCSVYCQLVIEQQTRKGQHPTSLIIVRPVSRYFEYCFIYSTLRSYFL